MGENVRSQVDKKDDGLLIIHGGSLRVWKVYPRPFSLTHRLNNSSYGPQTNGLRTTVKREPGDTRSY